MTDRAYLGAWAALLALLAATVGASFLDLGAFNVALALGIAAVKTLIVLAYFMHLKGEDRLLWASAASGFLWLALLILALLDEMNMRPQ